MRGSEYADYLSTILDCLHPEELIRLRRRVEKLGGGYAPLADYLSSQIKRRDKIEHEEQHGPDPKAVDAMLRRERAQGEH
jgi:cytidylate kinase